MLLPLMANNSDIHCKYKKKRKEPKVRPKSLPSQTPPRRPTSTKFRMRGRIPDIFLGFDFQKDRLENVGAVGGRNFGLPIDKAHRLYNSLLWSILYCARHITGHFGDGPPGNHLHWYGQQKLIAKPIKPIQILWHKIWKYTSYMRANVILTNKKRTHARPNYTNTKLRSAVSLTCALPWQGQGSVIVHSRRPTSLSVCLLRCERSKTTNSSKFSLCVEWWLS